MFSTIAFIAKIQPMKLELIKGSLIKVVRELTSDRCDQR